MQATLSEIRVQRDFYTTTQVAELYRVSKATVCNWCRAGALQASKVGEGRGRWRVHPQSIEDIDARRDDLIELSKRYWPMLLSKMKG